MKKILLSFFMVFVLFAPSIGHAQMVDQDVLKTQYIQALTALIDVLQRQVEMLMEQLELQVIAESNRNSTNSIGQTTPQTNPVKITQPSITITQMTPIKISRFFIRDDGKFFIDSSVFLDIPKMEFVKAAWKPKGEAETNNCDDARGCADYSDNSLLKVVATSTNQSFSNNVYHYEGMLDKQPVTLSDTKEGANADGDLFINMKVRVYTEDGRSVLSNEVLQRFANKEIQDVKFDN